MAKKLERATAAEIKEYMGKIVKIDCGSYYNGRLIEKAKIITIHKQKTVHGELIFTVEFLKEKYQKVVYKNEIV